HHRQEGGAHRRGDLESYQRAGRERVERLRRGPSPYGRRITYEPVRDGRNLETAGPAVLRQSARGSRVDRRKLHDVVDVPERPGRSTGAWSHGPAGLMMVSPTASTTTVGTPRALTLPRCSTSPSSPGKNWSVMTTVLVPGSSCPLEAIEAIM